MSRRRRRDDSVLSLDSFVDIVTNVLGLLILIAALVIVSNRDIKVALGTPLMAKAPDDLERVIFECRENRVVPVEEGFRNARVERVVAEWHDDGSAAADEQCVAAFREMNRSRASNDYHRFEWQAEVVPTFFGKRLSLTTVLHPVDEPVGTIVTDLRDDASDFQEHLEDYDPEKHWVFIIARENSFECLRAVRKILHERGFQVGWTPQANDEPLRFSSGGGLGGTTDG